MRSQPLPAQTETSPRPGARSRPCSIGRNPPASPSTRSIAWRTSARTRSFVKGLRKASTSRCLILSGEIPALKLDGETHDALFTFDEAKAIGKASHTVFLGCHGDRALFARLIEAASHDNSQDRGDLSFIDLRTIAIQGLVTPDIVGALSQAKSLLYWHKNNSFLRELR